VRSLFVLFSFSLIFASLPLRAQHSPDAPAPAGSLPAAATDTGLRRYELGFNTADIRTFCVGEKYCNLPAFSVGAGASINWNPHLALDTGVNVTTGSGAASTNFAGGRTVEVLAGVRGEIRARRYGYYVKVQPGFVYWSSVIQGASQSAFDTITFRYGGRTRFVTDMGGGIEYSLTPRVRVRGEFTDLLMRYSKANWRNDFQPSAGIYVGLGRSIVWSPPAYNAAAVHPFFDRANIVLLTASVLGMTADAITTQRGLAQGRGEANPIARPLVKYGWSGQISLEALETAADIAGMYGLHRAGHHWIERAVPVSLALAHAIFAYENASTTRNHAPGTP
jgi:hypothetical protein